MKKTCLAIILLSIVAIISNGCNSSKDIKVNGKKIRNTYKLAMYDTKPERSFAIMINDKTYLKLVASNGIVEAKIDSDKVCITNEVGLSGQYVEIYWANNACYDNFEQAISNVEKVIIYTESYKNNPLNMEY